MAKTSVTKVACILRTLKKLYPRPKTALSYVAPHECLFAVMLSAQTTDVQVNKVTPQLFTKFKELPDYAGALPASLEAAISSIGLYKTKSRNIIKTAQILLADHKGYVPKTITELVSLPGVGRKTANVVLGEVYGIATGIAVDTHVARLSRLYGLTDSKDPKKIEKDLMALLPQKEWIDFTHRLIWYGREYCRANCKKCPNCPLWACSAKIVALR